MLKNIKKNQIYTGIMNGEKILIINPGNEYITYQHLRTGRVFTVGRKMFERCLLELEHR